MKMISIRRGHLDCLCSAVDQPHEILADPCEVLELEDIARLVLSLTRRVRDDSHEGV